MGKGVVIGVGGWEHEVFDECFYPQPRLASLEKLRQFAQYFDAVEVRPTFWDESLTAEHARQWLGAVAGRPFLFSVKLHSSFTHRKSIRPHQTRIVRGILAELARHNRLAALLMQFPYAFTNTSGNRFHLLKLAELFRGFPLHVELRHVSWHIPQLLGFLSECGAAPVSTDFPRLKHFMPFFSGVIGDTAYLRLHGRNEKGWLSNGLDTRYDYLYNTREVQEIRRRVELLLPRCSQVLVMFNNSTGGKALANAFQLRSAMNGGKSLRIPARLLKAFPHLQQIAGDSGGGAPLFDGTYREAM